MADIRNYVILGLVALCVVLGISTYSYRTTGKASASALKTLEDQVRRTNKEAQDKYAVLEAENKTLEKKLKDKAKADEVQDAKESTKIADDVKRDTAPVSVRYITRYARSCGPGAEGQTSANADNRTGDTGEATGVLGPEAERRFKLAIAEVKMLQLGFNRCKERLTEELDADRN